MTTRRYAAFRRGVSPMNLKMPALKACFERCGFTDVKQGGGPAVAGAGHVAGARAPPAAVTPLS